MSDAQEGPKVMIDMIGQEQDVVAQEIECPVAISEPVEVVEVADCLGSLAEVDDDDSFGLELDTSDEQEERYCVKQDMGGDPELVIECVKAGPSNKSKLIEAIKSDPSLKHWKELADEECQGGS